MTTSMINARKTTLCQRSERDVSSRITERIFRNVEGDSMYPVALISYDYVIAKMASLRIPERAVLYK